MFNSPCSTCSTIIRRTVSKQTGDIQPLDLNDSTTSHLPGYVTALAFASRLLHQHESATAINNQSSATDSGPLSNAGDGFGDQSQAEGSQEALAPAPSDRANSSASSAPAAFDIIVQRLYSQLLDEDADTAQNGLTSVTHLPSNSEDSRPGPDNRPDSENNRPSSENRPSFGDNRPSSEDNRPSSEDSRPSSEDSRPNFQNNRPRPEDNRQDIRAEVVVGAPQSTPVSNGRGRDSKAERGSLSFILGKSSVEK
ncbi:hypothetical protein RB595_004855 [Gaeumannomyces hyphopodioides]